MHSEHRPHHLRAFSRWTTDLDVRYGDEDQISPGYGMDVSQAGLGFRGRKLYPPGTQIELAFRIDNPVASWIRAKAVVRHATPERMGVEFVEVPPQVRDQIVEHIFQDQMLRGRAS